MAGEETDADKQMIDQHPITPPPELVDQWWGEVGEVGDAGFRIALHIATQAARWGADQELEACATEVSFWSSRSLAERLRTARRPKPQSLKEQALALIDGCNDPHGDYLDDAALDTIRRALEALPDS